jgi:hypothetical protein
MLGAEGGVWALFPRALHQLVDDRARDLPSRPEAVDRDVGVICTVGYCKVMARETKATCKAPSPFTISVWLLLVVLTFELYVAEDHQGYLIRRQVLNWMDKQVISHCIGAHHHSALIIYRAFLGGSLHLHPSMDFVLIMIRSSYRCQRDDVWLREESPMLITFGVGWR